MVDVPSDLSAVQTKNETWKSSSLNQRRRRLTPPHTRRLGNSMQTVGSLISASVQTTREREMYPLLWWTRSCVIINKKKMSALINEPLEISSQCSCQNQPAVKKKRKRKWVYQPVRRQSQLFFCPRAEKKGREELITGRCCWSHRGSLIDVAFWRGAKICSFFFRSTILYDISSLRLHILLLSPSHFHRHRRVSAHARTFALYTLL